MKQLIVIGLLAFGFHASANTCADFTHVPTTIYTAIVDYGDSFVQEKVEVDLSSTEISYQCKEAVCVSGLSGVLKSLVGFLNPPRGDDVSDANSYASKHYIPPKIHFTYRRSRDGLNCTSAE